MGAGQSLVSAVGVAVPRLLGAICLRTSQYARSDQGSNQVDRRGRDSKVKRGCPPGRRMLCGWRPRRAFNSVTRTSVYAAATQSGSLGFSALSPLLKRNQNVSEVSALLIRRLTGLVVGVAPENVRPDRTTGLVGRNPLLLGAFL
jgi:hypothetical protein